MKYVYLTIDVEEWYDLDYLKKYNLNKNVKIIPEIINFLDMLDTHNVKATFFTLANIIDSNSDIIREIYRRGHEIACHGYDHDLLYDKSGNQFEEEIVKAKLEIESIIKSDIKGYRSACFSMERDKLDLTENNGYMYDSSYIKFEHHPLYRNLDLTGFEKLDDLVYKKDSFFEYEIPTLKIGKYSLPISGGGYLRLFPYWMLKILINIYEKQQSNFLIYLHPFELTNAKLPIGKEVSFKDKFRACIGRKRNIKKIEKLIVSLKNKGAEFRTISEDIEKRV